MTLPTYKIEIAFNAGVTTPADSRTWTDVTSYVLLDSGIEITYGRGDWRSEADANTLRLTLNNSDGRFTAGLSTSPYYPNVKLGRPIRVTATVDGVGSVRFLGFIDEWPVEWPAAVTSFATAQITASSRLAWLAEDVELRSIIEEEILVDGPLAYYTLGEPARATIASDTSGNSAVALSVTGTGAAVVFGTAAGPSTDGLLTAAQFSNGQYLRTTTNTGRGYEGFFNTSTTPAANAYLWQFVVFANGFTSTLQDVHVDTSGHLHGIAVGGVDVSTSFSVADGATHHFAFVASGTLTAPTWTLYVDGVSVGSASGSSILLLSGSETWLGPGFTGVIAHAVLSATIGLSAARISAHSAAGLTGFAGETPSARITRYASYADVPATELSLDTGQVPGLTHLDTTGTSALDMMRKIEATEEGILFDKADGTLSFHDRAHRYTAASSFTLDVSQSQVAPGMEPRLDRAAIRNDVSAASTDGTLTARVTNTTSQGSYGLARESLELATSNADEPFEHVSWLVNQYAEPQPRVPSLTVDLANPNVATVLSQSVLAATVSTGFTVTSMPSQAAASSQRYFVEGYSESIGNARHSITFNISQAQPYDVFTIGDPVFGQYDAYPIAL